MKRFSILLIAFSLTLITGLAAASLGSFRSSEPPAIFEEVFTSSKAALEARQGTLLREVPLPGRGVTLREAARECRGAIVAQLLGWRGKSPGPPGATDYDGTTWKVIAGLRGKDENEAVLDLTVQTMPEEIREEVPEIGRTYLIFSYPKNARQIRKVVVYSDDNVKQRSR